MAKENRFLSSGATLMVVGALIFIVYGVVFFLRSFVGPGFELGVSTLNGVTVEQLNALNPAVMNYIRHLHVATAEFIIATGIAVLGIAWFAVKRGEVWAWVTAVVSPVVGLIVIIPMHWFNLFAYNQLTHLGPIYAGTIIYVVGALIALKGLLEKPASD